MNRHFRVRFGALVVFDVGRTVYQQARHFRPRRSRHTDPPPVELDANRWNPALLFDLSNAVLLSRALRRRAAKRFVGPWNPGRDAPQVS